VCEKGEKVCMCVCVCVLRGKIINTNRDIPRRSARRKKNYLRPWYSLRMTLSKRISSTVKEHFFEFLYFFIFYYYTTITSFFYLIPFEGKSYKYVQVSIKKKKPLTSSRSAFTTIVPIVMYKKK